MSGGPPGVTISLTEAQGFQALGQFLQAVCAPYPITVVRALGSTSPGSNVRVPEPVAGDFVVMSSLRTDRLETDETTFSDNVSVGSISGTTLTVTSVLRGILAPGQLVIDFGYPSGYILPNTTIVSQLTSFAMGGAPGGIGTYQVSVAQSLGSETLYSGTREDRVEHEWVAQLDIHGPNGMGNALTIDALFRSEYGVDFLASTGFWISPLHADTAGQMPFENAEGEVEYRWVMEAHLAVVPIVTTPQQFADEVRIRQVVAGVNYTGGLLPPPPSPFPPTMPLPIFVSRTVSLTSNYDVLGSDSGTYFDNGNASTPITVVLPLPIPGLEYNFTVTSAQGLTILASVGVSIALGTANSAPGGSLSSNLRFSSVFIYAPSGVSNQWVAKSDTGGWNVD